MKYSFGNYRAAVSLGKILENEDKGVSAKVTSLVHDFYKSMNECEKITHKVTKEQVFLLFLKDYYNRIDEMVCSENIKSHMKCLIKAIYRRHLKILKVVYKLRNNQKLTEGENALFR